MSSSDAQALPSLKGRALVIGDVHAEEATLHSALRWAAGQGIDSLLCVGDIADGRGDLARTLELLVEHEVQCITGNHDRWALQRRLRQMTGAHDLDTAQRSFFESLPRLRIYDTPLGRLVMGHGVASDDMAHFASDTQLEVFEEAWLRWLHPSRPTVSIHVGGHTHEAMIRELGGEGLPRWALNAGTLRTRDDRRAKLLELDFTSGEAIILEQDLDDWRPVRRVALRNQAVSAPS